jgi:hypothetical protein
MGALKKSTESSPATEYPIVCPECHPTLADNRYQIGASAGKKRLQTKRPAIWKSHMRAHWDTRHDGVTMPPALRADLLLSDDEGARLRKNFGFPLSKKHVFELNADAML